MLLQTSEAETPKLQGQTLEQFLASVETRAWQMAWLSTRQREDALDLVQDSLLAFVNKYRNCPPEQRYPLFYRILTNRLRDWGRRQKVRQRWLLPWLRHTQEESGEEELWEPAAPGPGPEQHLHQDQFMAVARQVLFQLPARQREAFLLREWEGLDTAQTAQAMGVSIGSVKTHHHRAMQKLREALEEFR